jgi:hypothetical protein
MRLLAAERQALHVKRLLPLGRNGRVKPSGDVPAERSTDGGALADALRWAAAAEVLWVVQSADGAHLPRVGVSGWSRLHYRWFRPDRGG